MASMRMLVIKFLKKGPHQTTAEIMLDRELQSLQNVLPPDYIKTFTAVAGSKGVYRSDRDGYEMEILEILKALHSMSWRTVTSHALVHVNHTEETRFYLEKDFSRVVQQAHDSNEGSNRDDNRLETLRAAFRASTSNSQNNVTTSSGGAGAVTSPSVEDVKAPPRRPTLSAEAVASLLGKTNISGNNNNSSNNNTPTHNNFGFAPRGSLSATGIAKAASADSAGHITHAATATSQQKSEDHSQPAASVSAAPKSNVANASRTSSNILGLAQKFQVTKDSNGVILPRPASVAIMTSNYNSLVNGAAAASQTPSATAAAAATTTSTSSDATAAMSPDPADGKPEAKNPNSVVNKLLGKYNRKSFIATSRPSLVALASSETEESKGAAALATAADSQPESQPDNQPEAASVIQTNIPSFADSANKVESRPSLMNSAHSQSMPVMSAEPRASEVVEHPKQAED
eukprot:gene41964-51224_t